MVFHGISWYFMIFHGISWYFMVFHGTSWYFMVFHGISWYFIFILTSNFQENNLREFEPDISGFNFIQNQIYLVARKSKFKLEGFFKKPTFLKLKT